MTSYILHSTAMIALAQQHRHTRTHIRPKTKKAVLSSGTRSTQIPQKKVSVSPNLMVDIGKGKGGGGTVKYKFTKSNNDGLSASHVAMFLVTEILTRCTTYGKYAKNAFLLSKGSVFIIEKLFAQMAAEYLQTRSSDPLVIAIAKQATKILRGKVDFKTIALNTIGKNSFCKWSLIVQK